jgi:ABC-type phosphate transport system substrate-binding protein
MAVAVLRSRLARLAMVPLAVSIISLTTAAAPVSVGSFVPVSGSGSSFDSIAIDVWSSAVRPNGLVVSYNPDGSAAGRADYSAGQDDFTASDVPFRNGKDQLGGTGAEHPPWGFSYAPLAASSVAFMYDLSVSGHRVTNLKLSGRTLMEIYTGQITNWDDPRITHDYGSQLPNLPITPVIRADGSGVTYYFSRWMATVFPARWNAFCARVHPGIVPPCGQTEFYPRFGNAVAENGASNVLAYLTSGHNGAIGYDEYPYALAGRVPVLNLANAAGKFVPPLPGNVTTALRKALINTNPNSPDFLQQNLDPVYTDKDPGSYVLSFYSYWIVPRAGHKLPPDFTTAKGRTLSSFMIYALCAGQHNLAELGYGPLPPNLVAGGLGEVKSIPGHVPVPPLAQCH